MKFIADGMLGKLARWLRMLGRDVRYSVSLTDEQLIEIAKAEKRVLLTRDLKLYQLARKRGADTILVEDTTEAERLAYLAKQFNFELKIDVTLSRCPKCNTSVEPVAKDSILAKIPKATSTRYDEFWECPYCGQVYWQGSHWKKIEKTLKAARHILKNSSTESLL